MSAKMGRPTDDPKTIRKAFRISVEEDRRLKEQAKKLNVKEADVIRMGLEKMYQDGQKK